MVTVLFVALIIVLLVIGGVSSSWTFIVNDEDVIIELLSATLTKLNTIVYVPASVKVAFIGVVLVKSPCTANPDSGPQYPICPMSYSIPEESVARIFGVAGPVMSTLICTLVYVVPFTPTNNTFASFSTFFTTFPVYCKSKEYSSAANTKPKATKNYRKN